MRILDFMNNVKSIQVNAMYIILSICTDGSVDRCLFNTTKEERKFNIFKAENKDEKNWILKSLFPHPHDSNCLHCTFFF